MERHDVWELDGGGYSKNECAVLFEGRLYSNLRELFIAKFRSRAKIAAKTATKITAAFIPFLVLNRN